MSKNIPYIIAENGYYYVAYKEKVKVPEIVVSSKGIANGLSEEYNDGWDFGPDSYNPSITSGVPLTQTSGIQEALNYLQDIGISNNTSIAGKIFVKNGTYNITTAVNMPSLYAANPGTNADMDLLLTDGTTMSAPINKIDIKFEGESKDGVLLIMGDGTTNSVGGFNQAATISNSVNTTYKFKNMTWKPNPNYEAEGAISDRVGANFFNGNVSSFIFKNMRLTGIIGQNVNFGVFTGSTKYFNGFYNIFENVETRYIPGINTNPNGRVVTIIKNLDLWNSGYTDNAFAINQSGDDGSVEGLIIIDGIIIGQDEPVPSTVTQGGSALFFLAGGTLDGGTTPSSARVYARNIKIFPVTQTLMSSPFSIAQWHNVNAEIEQYNVNTYIGVVSYSKIKIIYYATSSSSPTCLTSGMITDSEIEVKGINLSGANIGSVLIALNSALTNVKFKINVRNYAFGTNSYLIANYSASGTAFTNVILDGDLTDQLSNSSVGISGIPIQISPTAVPYSKIAQNISPVSIPANPPVSGTVYQNTHPYAIEIDMPVYATTAGTAGYVTVAKGSTDTPSAIGSQYVSGDTSSSSVDIIRLRVPAGWYYEFTESGVTFGTASVFAD